MFSFSAAKEEKPESKDLLADLQDISDSERKTSTAESSMGNEKTKYILFIIYIQYVCMCVCV